MSDETARVTYLYRGIIKAEKGAINMSNPSCTETTTGFGSPYGEGTAPEPQGWPQVAGDVVDRHVRYRVNVETSVKGVKTFSCTVEMEGADMADVLARSDALVAELDRRYPAPGGN